MTFENYYTKDLCQKDCNFYIVDNNVNRCITDA